MKIIAVALGIVSIGFSANCQTKKIAVYVTQGGGDTVGASVAYALKEDINKSSRYSLAHNKETADYVIDLASADIGESYGGRRALASAIAVLIMFKTSACNDAWLEISHGIEISGIDHVQVTASEILAEFDHAAK